MKGRVGALIALGAGFNPILSGRENIYINGSVLGLTKMEIDARVEEIIDFSGIDDFIDSPVQSYSSGMVVRLGFSIATALRPDILLIDEVLAVGDARFVWKCLHRIKTLIARGASIILVSHDTGNLMRTCTTGLVLRNGTPAFYGALNNAILSYQKGNPEESAGKLSSIDLSSPIRIHKVEFVVDGRPSTSYSGNQELSVQVHVELIHALPQLRFVIGLFHGEHGALFHISSYKDGGWIRLGAGRHVISMAAGSLPLQFGTYYAEVNARGPSVADFYTARRSDGAIYVSEPEPNYEGFGVNGVLLPSCTWSILHE